MRGRLRVIAGEVGGLRLAAPKGARTRPTADRVKEALFAALGDEGIAGASVLDGYAGSGALAIEALSRGAARALLVDRDPAAVDAILSNLRTTGLSDRARVQRRPLAVVLREPPPPEAPFDLVFLDPPYDLPPGELVGVLDALGRGAWLSGRAVVVVERSAASELPLPAGWRVPWSREYGGTLVVVAEATADP